MVKTEVKQSGAACKGIVQSDAYGMLGYEKGKDALHRTNGGFTWLHRKNGKCQWDRLN